MASPATITLNNGYSCPVLGLGTFKAKDTRQAVKDAIDAGYRHIDTAAVYENEVEVGAGVRDKIEEGVIKRENIFVTSKLWCSNSRPDLVVPALRESLSKLGLDYLDLYLLHWPFAFQVETCSLAQLPKDGTSHLSDTDYLDTWRQMEECVRLGLARSIGVCNFNSQQLERLFGSCTVKPVTNQVECHPFLTQKRLIGFCRERDVMVTAYSPLANPSKQQAVGATRLMDHPKLQALADKYGKTPAQIVLRYLIQIGTNPIPKSATKSRIQENIRVFDFTLSEEDVQCVDSLNSNTRTCPFNEARASPYYPFSADF